MKSLQRFLKPLLAATVFASAFAQPAAHAATPNVVRVPVPGLAQGGTGPTQPADQFGFLASNMNFADVEIGDGSQSVATLRNTGTSAVTLTSVSVSGVSFALAGTTCGAVLGAGQSCDTTVAFAPTGAGESVGALTVSSPSGVRTVNLQGQGAPVQNQAPAELEFEETFIVLDPVNFGQPAYGRFLLRNTGEGPARDLSIKFTDIDGNPSSVYTIDSGTTCGKTLQPLQACTVYFTYRGTEAGPVYGLLGAEASNTPSTVQAAVLATLIVPDPVLQELIPITELKAGQKATATYQLSNQGPAPLRLDSSQGISIRGHGGNFQVESNSCGAVLSAHSGCTFQVSTKTAPAAGFKYAYQVYVRYESGIEGPSQSFSMTAVP